MNKYQVKINGKTIEVEVDLLEGTPFVSNVSLPASVQRVAAQAPAQAAPAAQAAPVAGDANQVTAPMNGNVLDIMVKEGDAVTKGQVLLIFEALKMENEVMAAQDGVIKQILVSKGSALQAGDVLMTLE